MRYTELWDSFESFSDVIWGIDDNWTFLEDTVVEEGRKTMFEFSTGGKRNVVVTIKEICGDKVKKLMKGYCNG